MEKCACRDEVAKWAEKRRFVADLADRDVFCKMPRTGLEPARLAALPPQSSASANSATWAWIGGHYRKDQWEVEPKPGAADIISVDLAMAGQP
jgi:hypothetical protein